MPRYTKPVELDYLPTRDGGEDLLHNHGIGPILDVTRENCPACAQLANDFAWIGFHDSVAASRDEFGTVEEAMAYAAENMDAKYDPGPWSSVPGTEISWHERQVHSRLSLLLPGRA